eukprot:6831814-Prymnesium_polylepis.2
MRRETSLAIVRARARGRACVIARGCGAARVRPEDRAAGWSDAAAVLQAADEAQKEQRQSDGLKGGEERGDGGVAVVLVVALPRRGDKGGR